LKDSAQQLRKRLKKVGLSDLAINAAWPTWWSDEADASTSAQTELRFSIARKLGLNPHSLLEDDREPVFIWKDEARFKHLSRESEIEKSAITSFGAALGRVLISAQPSWKSISGASALDLRNAILHSQPYVRLLDLISLSWSVGIPVIHLRVFPWPRKRMAAMSIGLDARSAILLAKDSMYPAHVAFYLAHELAHIALGHLGGQRVVVDFEDSDLLNRAEPPGVPDMEEIEADEYALDLLTGESQPRVLSINKHAGARSLADAALRASKELKIEPGTLALCFGASTGDWGIANGAMRYIYSSPSAVWRVVNQIAIKQLSLAEIPEDIQRYLEAVLGLEETARR
jgi:hypothetical protein